MIVFATNVYVAKTIILDSVLGPKLSSVIVGTIIHDLDFGAFRPVCYHGCIPKSTSAIAGTIKYEY